jgi:cyclopropane fatty-acyl-phospholipid synthase-like methyltransferase
MRSWFGLGAASGTPSDGAPIGPDIAPARQDPPPAWPIERLRTVDALWGEGYIFPDGEAETLRLAKPFGLSAASSLLLLGAGGGGPACTLARSFGARITAHEADPDLAVVATERVLRGNLGRRIRIETWNPSEAEFPPNAHHHCLALQPLSGARSEPLFAALAGALKPGGHLMLLELVADAPLDPADPIVADWSLRERRPANGLPAEVAITRALGRLGFDVQTTQDVSARSMQQALIGWRRRVRAIEAERPSPREGAHLVREAELWLLRTRLFRDGRLRLIQWHAVRR